MASHRFRCAACKRLTESRVKGQRYCGREKCQKARKNAWRRDRYAADADYRANQAQSTKAWLESVGGAACYHRQYRKRRKQRGKAEPQARQEHGVTRVPVVAVVPQNAPPQSEAAAQSETRPDANSDAEMAQSPVKSGVYLLTNVGGANSDAVLVEIKAVSVGYG